jgi:hypothetical protein
MRWVGYGLQGVGGLMAITGMGVFALGKLVERAAGRGAEEAPDGSSEVEVVAVL